MWLKCTKNTAEWFTLWAKKQALHKAAKLNDLGYKDYMKVRRKAGME